MVVVSISFRVFHANIMALTGWSALRALAIGTCTLNLKPLAPLIMFLQCLSFSILLPTDDLSNFEDSSE